MTPHRDNVQIESVYLRSGSVMGTVIALMVKMNSTVVSLLCSLNVVLN